MVIPKLFRNKKKDYLIYARPRCYLCKLVHDIFEPKSRLPKAEFEKMLSGFGVWHQYYNPWSLRMSQVQVENAIIKKKAKRHSF